MLSSPGSAAGGAAAARPVGAHPGPAVGGAAGQRPPHGPVGPAGLRPAAQPAIRRGRTTGGILAGRIIAAIAAVAVLLATGFGFATNQSGDSDALASANQIAKIPGGGITILLIGSDSRSHADGTPLSAQELKLVSTQESNGINTDTLMLLHIPADGSRATAVSIPRDTWIDTTVTSQAGVVGPYPNGSTGPYKPNKINSFYGTAKEYTVEYLAKQGISGAERERRSSEAGRQMLIQIISKFSGMHIDHFAEVNLIAFYTISNALEGVPVCLKNAVSDHFSGADFKAGLQQVQGSAALAFVRQRHGLPGGDLDRVRRQQAFLSGAMKKILTNVSTLPALTDAASKSLVMDKGLDLLTLGQQMQALAGGKVTFQTLPTHGAAAGAGTDALATDPAEVAAFFARIRAGASASTTTARSSSAPAQKVTVDVQNGTMTSGLGKTVSTILQGKGMTVTAPTDMAGKSNRNQLDTTEVRYPSGAKARADTVVAALGFGKATAGSPVAAGHILVVVGKDAPKSNGLRGAAPAFAVAATPDSIDGVPCIN